MFPMIKLTVNETEMSANNHNTCTLYCRRD